MRFRLKMQLEQRKAIEQEIKKIQAAEEEEIRKQKAAEKAKAQLEAEKLKIRKAPKPKPPMPEEKDDFAVAHLVRKLYGQF